MFVESLVELFITNPFKNEVLTNPSKNTKEIIAISLINIFKDGPEVSLRGSPTVSPITAALCYSECFFYTTPF